MAVQQRRPSLMGHGRLQHFLVASERRSYAMTHPANEGEEVKVRQVLEVEVKEEHQGMMYTRQLSLTQTTDIRLGWKVIWLGSWYNYRLV